MRTRMLLRLFLIASLLVCYLWLSCALENDKKRGQSQSQSRVKNADGAADVKMNHTVGNYKRTKPLIPSKKVKGTGRKRPGLTNDSGCTRLGGICQPDRYICQGRYLRDKCSKARTHQCCMPVGAWSVLCAGHHNNRVRACDVYGCGAFNSGRGVELHRAVDVVCDDYGVVNAPFSGSLAGPVGHSGTHGMQYDGVKLRNHVHCVQILNIRPYRYVGPVSQGEALGYLLPLQERLAGITSHLELRMCDGSDPSPFI